MTRPSLVPRALVRRLVREDEEHFDAVVQHVAPAVLVPPHTVPRQLDAAALRRMALQLHSDARESERTG